MNSEELQGIFFGECEESLEATEAGLAQCQAGTQDAETINSIFRAVHSIKGGAGAFGYGQLQAFTHGFETLLADVREGSVALDEKLVDLLLRALDCTCDHVAAAREGGDLPDDAGLLKELSAALADGGVSEDDTSQQPEVAAPVADLAPQSPSQDDGVADFDLDLDALLDDLVGPDDDEAPETTEIAKTDIADIAPEEASATQDGHWLVHIRPNAKAMCNGFEPLFLLRELSELGGQCIACDHAQLPGLDALQVDQAYLGWTYQMPASVGQDVVQEIFLFMHDRCALSFGADVPAPAVEEAPVHADAADQKSLGAVPVAAAKVPPVFAENQPEAGAVKAIQPAPASKPNAPVSQSVRIDLAKLDKLIDGVGELIIAQSMLAQRLDSEGRGNIEELAALEGLVRDIQENAMAFRAQPIGAVFGRMPRLVRELASSTGKRVKLDMSGEATELDKSVIERLGDPLTHLIRNAVDHGIEEEADRLAAGKPEEGVVTLSAQQRAGRIIIRVSDDGAGIDRERLFAKAVEKGICTPDEQLSGEEIDHLIFAPGFSTANSVSNISGRGVGMDVVRQNVKELGGNIKIESRPGKGTDFILVMPLTLAISDGMIVRVGDQSLVVPLSHVVESLRPKESDLKGLGSDRMMLNARGRFIPVIKLDAAVGAHGNDVDPTKGVLIVVETETAGQAALLVNEITDQRQFVIKSLDRHFAAVEGIAGATIMGNGRVALILDVDQLVPSGKTSQRLELAA